MSILNNKVYICNNQLWKTCKSIVISINNLKSLSKDNKVNKLHLLLPKLIIVYNFKIKKISHIYPFITTKILNFITGFF